MSDAIQAALAKADYKSQLATKDRIKKYVPDWNTDNEKLTESISNQFRPQPDPQFAFSPKGDELK